MKTLLVASAKGGVGKTTLATQLAGQAAVAGDVCVLVDVDPQGSARRWAERRNAAGRSRVLPLDGTSPVWRKRIPSDTTRLIIDAPAGAMPGDLAEFLDLADAVIVPTPPSPLDMEATLPFLNALAMHPGVRRGSLPVGLVANKLKPWTRSSQEATAQMANWPVPLIAELREGQAYMLMAGLGSSLFDYQSANVRQHQADWQPLLEWLE